MRYVPSVSYTHLDVYKRQEPVVAVGLDDVHVVLLAALANHLARARVLADEPVEAEVLVGRRRVAAVGEVGVGIPRASGRDPLESHVPPRVEAAPLMVADLVIGVDDRVLRPDVPVLVRVCLLYTSRCV